MGYWREATDIKGPSGFRSGNTAEQVTEGIDASRLTVIITGGSSGIGVETVRVLALRGAYVIIGVRNLEAANTVKQNILSSIPSTRIDIIQIELSSLKSVRAFTDKFLTMNLPLNILINNAGVMYCPSHKGVLPIAPFLLVCGFSLALFGFFRLPNDLEILYCLRSELYPPAKEEIAQ